MYLRKLYKQSKLWFVIVVLFAAGQLFINYKRGIELSPFYHYSMFSLPFHFATAYQVVEVTVNGRKLQAKDFSPNKWDNFIIPVTQYQNQQGWNSLLYNTTIKRLLRVSDSSLYLNYLPKNIFNQWYQQRVARLLNITDTTVTIKYYIAEYKQKNDSLYH